MSERLSTIDEKIAFVGDWIKTLSETGLVGEEISPGILREVLESFGADFQEKPELDNLSKYGNVFKRPGLDAVWGKGRIDKIRNWIREEYISDYETRKGIEMYTLEGTDIKYSGMLQFLGELTAFAAGRLSNEDFTRLTENRIQKGKAWEERKPEDPYIRTKNALFPPEFPVIFWNFLKTQQS